MDREQAVCANCGKALTLWEGQWFHTHNSTTFCNGIAANIAGSTGKSNPVKVIPIEAEVPTFDEAVC